MRFSYGDFILIGRSSDLLTNLRIPHCSICWGGAGWRGVGKKSIIEIGDADIIGTGVRLYVSKYID